MEKLLCQEGTVSPEQVTQGDDGIFFLETFQDLTR